MKKQILFVLLFTVQFYFAQFDKIALEIEGILLARTEKTENSNSVRQFFANFSTAEAVQSEDLIRDYVGICYKSSAEKQYQLFPAKYSVDLPFEKGKTSYFNLNPIDKSISEDKPEDYLKLFLENSPKVSENKYFMHLKYVDSDKKGRVEKVKNDIAIGDDDYLTLLKKKDKKIYAISFQLTALDAKNLSISEIRLYIFNQNLISSEDYMMILMEKDRKKKWAKEEVLRKVYPLFHDYRIDEVKTALRYLLKDPKYKADETFVKYAKNFREKLDRTNIANYTDELLYFSTLKIDEQYRKDLSEEILNLNHTSCHSLGDIYLGKEDHVSAEKYFKMALLDYPIFTFSGTTGEKDLHRLLYDLAKIYKKLGRKNEAYGYFMALLNSQIYYEEAEKEMAEILATDEDHKRLKKDIDKALKTFKIRSKPEENKSDVEQFILCKDDFSEFTFRDHKILFLVIFLSNKDNFTKNITKSVFYQSLR